MTAKQRINALIQAINVSSEPDKNEYLKDIEEFISDCGKYIDAVLAMEAALSVARYHMEPEEYREHIINLDRRRKIYHDNLVASVKLMNKYAKNFDCEPIYTGPDERIAIAEFAMDVAKEFYAERKL